MKKHFTTKIFIGLLLIGSLSSISYKFLVSEKLKTGTNNVVTDDIREKELRKIARAIPKKNPVIIKIPNHQPKRDGGKVDMFSSYPKAPNGKPKHKARKEYLGKKYMVINKTSYDNIFIDYSNPESLESFICSTGSGGSEIIANKKAKFTRVDCSVIYPSYSLPKVIMQTEGNDTHSDPNDPKKSIRFIEVERPIGTACDEISAWLFQFS